MSDSMKETTFIKQVERQCKHDAYEAALCWGKRDQISKKDLMWYLEEKMNSHAEYLSSVPFEYDYGSQTLVEKRVYKSELIDDSAKALNESSHE